MSNGAAESLETRIFAYGEVVDALCRLFDAGDGRRKAIIGRIKSYQGAGLAPPSRGPGRAIVYGLSDVYNYAFALTLAERGFDQRHIAAIIQRGSFLKRFGDALALCDKARVEKIGAHLQHEDLVLVLFQSLFYDENSSTDADPIKMEALPSWQVVPKLITPLLQNKVAGLAPGEDYAEAIGVALSSLGAVLINVTSLRDRVREELDR